MTALAQHVEDYLEIRRGLGFKLGNEQRMPSNFAAFMDRAGEATITIEMAVALGHDADRCR